MWDAIIQMFDSISEFGIPVMIVLMLVALGGLFSERSGVINIALEGIMVMGAFICVLIIFFLSITHDVPLQISIIVGLIGGALAGMLFSWAHAFASVSMNSNQIISATALNIFATAISVFTARTFIVNPGTTRSTDRISISSLRGFQIDVPILKDIPIIGDFLFTEAFLSTFIGFGVLIVVYIVFARTRLGLRIQSCGENPHAADSLGINVKNVRYTGVLISGLLAGLGGATYAISFARAFNGQVRGLGFLALAILISGQWKPLRVFFFAMVFSFFYVVQAQQDSLAIIGWLNMSEHIFDMVPYIIPLVILAFLSKRSQAPKAIGEPYDVSKR